MQESFLQSNQWAQFKKNQDWLARKIDDIFVLEHKLPFGLSLMYAPEVSAKPNDIRVIQDKISELISNSAIFFRLEIVNEINSDYVAALETAGFVKSFEQMQPEFRQVIDLTPPLETILKKMKPKGRYNINVARRHGVRVTAGSDIKTFYKLYAQAARRDKFSARAEKYFMDLIEYFPNEAEIFAAYYQNQPLATALVIFWQGTASFLYGGSSSLYRNVMAPHLLHYKIVEEAKRRKMKYYDLLAIAPDNNQSHKYGGLRRFKQQFGGRQVDLVGSWDLIFKPGWYMIYRLAESLRR